MERALVLAAPDFAALGHVRHLPGLRAAAAPDGRLWLRGLPAAETPLPLRQLPALVSYALDEHGNLFAAGSRTPTARLPELAWQPIREFVPLEIPTAALPGQSPPAYHLRLVPSAQPQPGAALLTTLPAWQAYAATAPEVRLHRLRFAVSSHHEVLLLGTPLPPLPGRELWLRDGLLLPAGLDFEAPLLSALVAAKLRPDPTALLLFAADATWTVLAASSLQPATRSAVRLTPGPVAHG